MEEEERVAERDSQTNYIKPSFSSITNFFKDQNEMEFLSGAIAYLIVPLLLAIVSIFSFILFILFFFFCKESKRKEQKTIKILWYIQLTLGWGFLIFFIIFLVYGT